MYTFVQSRDSDIRLEVSKQQFPGCVTIDLVFGQASP